MASVSTYLLDTNILLHLLRGKEAGMRINADFRISGNLHRSVISIITVGELYTLARRNKWGKQKMEALEQSINELVIVDITHPEITRAYGEIAQASKGIAIGQNDIWIAATCKVTNATLLTCDGDFNHLIERNVIDGIFVTVNA